MDTTSQSLLSTIVTLYIIILLYFPQFFIKITLSPPLISTLVILLTLLRLGTSQRLEKQQRRRRQQQQPSINPAAQGTNNVSYHTQNDHETFENKPFGEHSTEPELELVLDHEPEPDPDKIETNLSHDHDHDQEGEVEPQCIEAEAHTSLDPGPVTGSETCWVRADPESDFDTNMFLEWNVGAPLEVIYEAYEGEEEEGEAENDAFWWNDDKCKVGIIERYPSLSRYYPESDSDSDSDSDSSLSTSFNDEEEDREELIEISLDYGYVDKKIISNMIMKPKVVGQEEGDHNFDEEDNLIEIDISPTKVMSDFCW